MDETTQPAPPSDQVYWDRKWRLAKKGANFSALVILVGLFAAVVGGQDTGQAVFPFCALGVSAGMAPMAGYITNATFVEVARIKRP